MYNTIIQIIVMHNTENVYQPCDPDSYLKRQKQTLRTYEIADVAEVLMAHSHASYSLSLQAWEFDSISHGAHQLANFPYLHKL